MTPKKATAATPAPAPSNGAAVESQFVKRIKAARFVSTPIVAVATPDPAATIGLVQKLFADAPVLAWDIVRGIQGMNDRGQEVALELLGGKDPALMSNPIETLMAIADTPQDTIVFFQNAHRYLTNEVNAAPAIQAVWNLRDVFKSKGNMLILLAPQITLPAEIASDVYLLDEPLPNREELAGIVAGLCAGDEENPPIKMTGQDMERACDALLGLPAFQAEQQTAMCIRKDRLDIKELWERKRKTISQTPGLTVESGNQTFADIRGCQNVIAFLKQLFAGGKPPRCLVLIDEINDALAGTAGDNSGVSQEMHGTLLSWMTDKDANGFLSIGVAGSGKTAIPKAAAGEFGVPLIKFDLSGMKGSLVGESGANLRRALAVVDAISQGEMLFIGTCNSDSNLTPQIKRRFNFGTFFYDLLTDEEREAIWTLYLNKFKIADNKLPAAAGWTAAEVRNCCLLASADKLNCSLEAAAAYISPIIKTDARGIEGLRAQANGRWISAAKPGLYQLQATVQAPAGRRIRTESA